MRDRGSENEEIERGKKGDKNRMCFLSWIEERKNSAPTEKMEEEREKEKNEVLKWTISPLHT